jgi:hypothetical protein
VADENEPATKGDLSAGLHDLERRLRAELASKDDLAALEQRLDAKIGTLDAKMGAMENRLLREIGQALNVAVEQIGAKVSVLDDKYKDLPARVAVVEREIAELKTRGPAPPASPPASRKRRAAAKRPAPPSRRKKSAR